MYINGMIAERVNLRYSLTMGMVFAGLCNILFGIAYYLDIHSLGYFYAIQVLTGIGQSTGWPGMSLYSELGFRYLCDILYYRCVGYCSKLVRSYQEGIDIWHMELAHLCGQYSRCCRSRDLCRDCMGIVIHSAWTHYRLHRHSGLLVSCNK